MNLFYFIFILEEENSKKITSGNSKNPFPNYPSRKISNCTYKEKFVKLLKIS